MTEPTKRREAPPPMGGRPGGPPGMHMGPRPKLKNAKGTLLRLLGYLGGKTLLLAIVFAATVVSTVSTVVGTKMNGSIIDETIASGDPAGLARACLILFGVYLVGVAASQVQNRLMIDVAQGTVTKLRRELFERIQGLPVRFFDQNAHGDLMSRFTNDVENINATLSQSVAQFFGNVISVVVTLAAMMLLSPLMTLASLLTVPLMMAVTRFIARLTRRYFKAQQDTLGELNGLVEETIAGQKVVKAYAREEHMKARFAEVNGRLRTAGLRAQVYSGLMGPVMNMINNFSYALVTAFGAWMVLNGSGVTVGVVFAFLLYMRQFGRPVNEIANLFSSIQSALAGAERIFSVMDEPPEAADEPGAPALRDIRGRVEASFVTFGYVPEKQVLKDASFTAEPGQTIALVGPTGAGKTTVVNLLTRFYDVDAGSLSIDGLDIRRYGRSSLRSSLGIVLQDTCLFSETVRENIRYGRLDATDAEVEQAARVANAEPFILRLPHGYDTVLSDDGGNLSQGQRQLISIARAVLADPAILILDEATSSVDTRTEVHIQQAMLELMRGRTSFVIAHRLSTIRNADQILVINGGEIVERGTHAELMERQGFYAELQSSQFRTGLAL